MIPVEAETNDGPSPATTLPEKNDAGPFITAHGLGCVILDVVVVNSLLSASRTWKQVA